MKAFGQAAEGEKLHPSFSYLSHHLDHHLNQQQHKQQEQVKAEGRGEDRLLPLFSLSNGSKFGSNGSTSSRTNLVSQVRFAASVKENQIPI